MALYLELQVEGSLAGPYGDSRVTFSGPPVVLTAPVKRDDSSEGCRICRAELEAHERPEKICNRCLRAFQVLPRNTLAA